MNTGLNVLLSDPSRLAGRSVRFIGPERIRSALGHAGIDLVLDEDADVIVVDLPRSGCRLTGEHDVLLGAMADAATLRSTLMVLDRPNPLGGVYVEGPTVALRLRGRGRPVPLPLRHGLTLGELAHWVQRSSGVDCPLQVVECDGWDRVLGPHPAPELRSPAWHLPVLFPGLGFVAAACALTWTPQSATTLCFAADDIDGGRLYDLTVKGAADADVAGVRFGPHPSGLAVEVVDSHAVEPVRVGLVVLEALVREHEARRDRSFWDRTGDSFRIDSVTGTGELRVALSARLRPTELLEAWQPEIDQFVEDRETVLLGG